MQKISNPIVCKTADSYFVILYGQRKTQKQTVITHVSSFCVKKTGQESRKNRYDSIILRGLDSDWKPAGLWGPGLTTSKKLPSSPAFSRGISHVFPLGLLHDAPNCTHESFRTVQMFLRQYVTLLSWTVQHVYEYIYLYIYLKSIYI